MRWSRRGRSAPAPRVSPLGRRQPALAGVDPDGRAVSVDPAPGRTVAVFLTVGCRECRALWPHLGHLAGTADARLVAVTPGPGGESARAVAGVAPGPPAVTVMSDDAWFSWGAGAAPWVVVVDDGVVTAEGTVTDPATVAARLRTGGA